MTSLLQSTLPELILLTIACVLFLLGVINKPAARHLAPVLAIAALIGVFFHLATHGPEGGTIVDNFNAFRISGFAHYIKLITAGVGILLVLLAWPTNASGTANPALEFGQDAGEFFGLMLISLAGVMLVAGANDIILLFLGIELASIPTYIMVSISRPIPAAQEAGVKYFFLGAMAAAIILFGFSYLYGTTGLLRLDQLTERFAATALRAADATNLTAWQQLAVLMLILGLCFKIAAVPLHFYAADVYQGAATPVTAFLSFVPKTSGFVAIIKILFAVTGGAWLAPGFLIKLLWIIAVLTMTFGNVLGLLQFNVKRVFAYSSIAHSGYILVGLTALIATSDPQTHDSALQGVLFYLAAYGITNAAAFGVLMLIPARIDPYTSLSDEGQRSAVSPPATSAETFEDLAGQAKAHPALAFAMSITCFSLIGLPLTVGFFGKLLLIRPALDAHLYWLVVATVINAAISAAYYLRIVATMYLRSEPPLTEIPARSAAPSPPAFALPITLAILLSAGGTVLFGALWPATQILTAQTTTASDMGNTETPRVASSTP